MKKPIVYALMALLCLACKKKSTDSFMINGNVENPEDAYIYLLEEKEGKQAKVDSVKPQGKSFTFTVKNSESTFYQINLFGKQMGMLVGAPGDEVKILADGNMPNGKFEVSGTADNEILAIADKKVRNYQNVVGELRTKFEQISSSGDTTGMGNILKNYESLTEQFIGNTKTMIDSVGNSVVALSLASNFLDMNTDFAFMEKLSEKFKKELPNSKYTKQFIALVDKKKSLQEGQLAPDFELKSSKGEFIKLSSLRGKVVIIDFWASWCRPCREENPNVVRVYNKYKSKGLEILGVSLDDNNDDWQEAIKKDKLTWLHVSELMGWESEIAKRYQVEGIPATFVLNREGKIVAKNLRGKELEEKIAQLL